MSISNRSHFEISFADQIEPLSSLWKEIALFLENSKNLPGTFYLSQIAGHSSCQTSEQDLVLSPIEIEHTIAERKLSGFHVHTGHSVDSLSFFLTQVGASKDNNTLFSKLTCRFEKKAKVPKRWGTLIQSLIDCWIPIGAWQYSLMYQAWQWDKVASEHYQRRWGIIPSGFKTYMSKYNMRASAITQKTMLDISFNPGRPKKLTLGVNFYPTAEMWLGPHFWQYAKCTKEEAFAADFFIEKRDTPHYTYFRCWPEPFTRPDGEQGRMQQRLWKLFFHEDCEWPPGSGTICDEPMYGPPELMPDYKAED